MESDLLLRHEKLVHSSNSSRILGRSSTAAIPTLAPRPQRDLSFNDGATSSTENSSQHLRTLDGPLSESLADAARQFVSDESLSSGPVPQVDFLGSQPNRTNFGIIAHSGAEFNNPTYLMPGQLDLPEDYNLFLDDFDLSNLYLPSSVFDSELPTSLWVRPGSDVILESQARNKSWEVPQEEHNPLSRFGSRLPSLQPEDQDPIENEPIPRANFVRAGPPWKISGEDHREIKLKLEEFADVLPNGFTLPSRHALSQFFEGYISGFHRHLPFLHSPTLVASKCAPELLLAIVAVGAQYRFESNKGNNLWYAARAIAFEQTRRRQSQKVAVILSSPTPRPTSYIKSPVSSGGTSESLGQQSLTGSQHDSDPNDPR